MALESWFYWRCLSPLAWPAFSCKASPPSQFSASFFCLFLVGWAASAGKTPSSAALPVPPNVAHFQLRGAASYHSRQQHATSMSWCMGSSSVDAMLTCPRPLLCCCSGPSGRASAGVCGLGLSPFLYPVHQPVCAMRWGALEHTCLPHCCMPGAVWSADAGGK